jgi:hypothetical protein
VVLFLFRCFAFLYQSYVCIVVCTQITYY